MTTNQRGRFYRNTVYVYNPLHRREFERTRLGRSDIFVGTTRAAVVDLWRSDRARRHLQTDNVLHGRRPAWHTTVVDVVAPTGDFLPSSSSSESVLKSNQTRLCWASYLGSQHDATRMQSQIGHLQLSIDREGICCPRPGCGKWQMSIDGTDRRTDRRTDGWTDGHRTCTAHHAGIVNKTLMQNRNLKPDLHSTQTSTW